MTAQAPERIIIDNRPRALYAQPLYRFLASRRMTLKGRTACVSSGCWRGYCGTWEIVGGRLHLIHLNLMGMDEEPMPPELRAQFLRAVPCRDFPVPAFWFNGRLRIAVGRRLVYSHHGWSHWFERERVITIREGEVKRDRLVDTRAMLERKLRRDPSMRDALERRDDRGALGPLIWFDDDDEDWEADWWPPDYSRELSPTEATQASMRR